MREEMLKAPHEGHHAAIDIRQAPLGTGLVEVGLALTFHLNMRCSGHPCALSSPRG